LKEGKEEVQQYLVLAAKYGCEGVVIKVEMLHPNNGLDFSGLKLILYNQEGSKATAAELLQLSRHPQVVAIKDSSENVSLFNELSESLAREGSAVKLYQGMETTILQTPDADGMLISLANVEPSFCRKLLSEQGGKAAQELDGYIERYNLKDGQWYKSLKEALYSMKVINSPQLVGQE
jgi:dihydrodipicolinate synthase/N-acetylneuraminate lyase